MWIRRVKDENVYLVSFTMKTGLKEERVYLFDLTPYVDNVADAEDIPGAYPIDPPEIRAFRTYLNEKIAPEIGLVDDDNLPDTDHPDYYELVNLFWQLFPVLHMTGITFSKIDMKMSGLINPFTPTPCSVWPPEVVEPNEDKPDTLTYPLDCNVESIDELSQAVLERPLQVPSLSIIDLNGRREHRSCKPLAKIVETVIASSKIDTISEQTVDIGMWFLDEDLKMKFFEILLEKTGNFDGKIDPDSLSYAWGPITPPPGLTGDPMPIYYKLPQDPSYWNELGIQVVFTRYRLSKIAVTARGEAYHAFKQPRYVWKTSISSGTVSGLVENDDVCSFTIESPPELDPGAEVPPHQQGVFSASLSLEVLPPSSSGIAGLAAALLFYYPYKDSVSVDGRYIVRELTDLIIDLDAIKAKVMHDIDEYIALLAKIAPSGWSMPRQPGGPGARPDIPFRGPARRADCGYRERERSHRTRRLKSSATANENQTYEKRQRQQDRNQRP
jgi:hypothetical protein